MSKAGFMKDAAVLFAITLVAGAALGGVYQVTKEPISRAAVAANYTAYKAVFNEAESFELDDALRGHRRLQYRAGWYELRQRSG